ncbi:esterase FE4-like [Aricia agestis]|uniref:esterase FE4-like n=1 Tax=Aricia agestis TaxID=91739 RepID=UPI001C207F08|nr:esterase FE4-like [Aricia agestis]XP_041976600.1 esterase FE4-like [Aricia agestis]
MTNVKIKSVGLGTIFVNNVNIKYLVLFSLFVMNLVDQPAPEVSLAQGVVGGRISADGTVLQYIGIPYATVEKRFQAPGPPPRWRGVYKAVDDIYMCPQSLGFLVVGTEDCLKINVYVPAHAMGPLPVMFWIHGGAFKLGSGGNFLYGPNFLVQKDVILVTFNYRLGALGFTCLKIKEAPGNAGLKDQVAALKWVKNNIAAFGGDPNAITIFGESAGGTSVSLLLASKATEGLFSKAIVQSGTSIAPWGTNRNPVWIESLLAKASGHNTEDPHEIYKIFSEMNYKDLTSIKATKPLDIFFETQLFHMPCVEEDIPGAEPLITDLPYNLMTKYPKDIPMMFGFNSNEGIFLIAMETSKELIEERNGRYLIGSDLKFSSHSEAMAVSDKVKQFYFGDDRIGWDKVLNMSELYKHLYFELPNIFESQIYNERNKSSVYNYVFDYSGRRNFMKFLTGFWNQPGASHADDLAYLFNGYILPFRINSEDAKIIDYMTTMWTNFAKYGNPTPGDLPVRWAPSTRDKLTFLYIDQELRTADMPSPSAYRLWRDIYHQYRDTNVT